VSRDLKIVSAAMLIWGFGEGMFLIFQPLYIQQLGANPILIGSILGINGLVMTLSQIPSGYLADKIGRRPMIWFSFIAGTGAAILMALAPTLVFFVGGMLLYGLTSSVMAPLNTYVQGARGKWSVGKAVSFVSASYNIGGVLGPLVGGIIGQSLNLRSVYYVSSVVFVLSTIIILFAGKQALSEMPSMEGDGHLLQNKRYLGMLVMIFVVMFAVMLPQPLSANFLQNQRGLSISRIGEIGSLGALGSVLFMLIFGNFQAGSALLVGQIGVLLFALLLWQGTGPVWYGIGYLFLGGFRLCRAMTVAWVQPVVRDHEVGLAFGIVESLNALAMMIAPVIAGFLYDWKPVSIFWVGMGVLVITSLATFGFISKKKNQI
jgi:MFS family permease